MYEIIFYQDKKGNKPVAEFIIGLSNKESKSARIESNKILKYIDSLETYGTRVGEPIVKHIDGDIWELRPNQNRILFFLWYENKIVLLHHFKKTAQKTPVREIERAKRYKMDWIGRNIK